MPDFLYNKESKKVLRNYTASFIGVQYKLVCQDIHMT